MKRLIVIFAILTLLPTALRADGDMDQVWDRANKAYIEEDYTRAIVTYDSIASTGYTGRRLYYNLGNAWFKNGDIGKAILNYHRALRIDPSDSDTRHNLRVAEVYVKDKIEPVPEFFLTEWIRALRSSVSSDGWAVLSLVLFAAAAGGVLAFLLSRRTARRKVGFYVALTGLAVGLLAVNFSVVQKQAITSSDTAVVMAGSASVKSSPDGASRDLFILHEGTVVRITGSLGGWKEISIADGNKGWIPDDAIEII